MPSNKTVAEKAKERAEETQDIVSATEQSIAPVGGLTIAGIEGVDIDDISMPYVYLVRSGAKHATLSNGDLAQPGSFYHNTRKTAPKEMEVLIAHAQKSREEAQKDGQPVFKEDGSKAMNRVWRTLMLGTNSLYSPFSMSFRGINNYVGWKEFLTNLRDAEVKNYRSKVYKLTSRTTPTKHGETLVVQIEILRDATKDEQTVANDLASRFSTRIEEPEVDIDAMIGELAE